jgi:hypothetical protein
MLQRIWAIGLMEKWFCICENLVNPKDNADLDPNCL